MSSVKNNAEVEVLNEELGMFLHLASGEIKMSVREASEVVQTLTKTFMEMVGDVYEIQQSAEKLSDEGENGKAKRLILNKCTDYLDKVQAGTVGFQFYDKMSQRLNHTSGNLNKLIELTEESDGLSCSESWKVLKKDVEQSYTMEDGRVLYKALMKGDSIQSAIRLAKEVMEKQQNSGNTELF